MKKLFLLSLLAMLTLTASAQTNTYSMVIETQNGTKLTIGPNEVKNVSFKNGELTVSGETIETLVSNAVNEAKEYTDQAAANLKGYIDLAVALEQVKGSLSTLAATVDGNKSEAASSLKAAVEGLQAHLAAVNTLVGNNDAAIRALIDTKVSQLQALIEGNANDINNNAGELVIMKNGISKNAMDIIAQGKDITNLQDVVAALQTALGKETAATLKAYAESVAKNSADKALSDAKGYADAQDAGQKTTIMQAIKDQAAQDALAWRSAIDVAVENLVKTYRLNALSEIISSQINEAIVNLIQTYNLQKP